MYGPPYGYPPYPYHPPQSGVVYVPVPQNSPNPKAPKGQKKLEKMARKSLVQRLEELNSEMGEIERFLKSKEKSKEDKPKDLWNRNFTFAETLVWVMIGAIPVTLALHRIVKYAALQLGIQ